MMNKRLLQGFTLVEMIVVIVITGIIASVVAVFLRAPVQGYADSARRAELTDIADTALRRVSRDLRTALPNSVRWTNGAGGACAVGPGPCYIEFIPTLGGGRYRAGAAAAGVPVCGGALAGDVLDTFETDETVPDICFQVLDPVMPPVAVGNQIVVYNTGATDPLGLRSSNAYAGNTTAEHNRRVVTGVGANSITLALVAVLPFSSCVTDTTPGSPTFGLIIGGCRFHVVDTAVSYVCDGAGNLLRWQGYAIPVAQPVALPGGGTSVVLATNVSDCRFDYAPGISEREGLATMHLSITEEGETVAMYAATHVSNVP